MDQPQDLKGKRVAVVGAGPGGLSAAIAFQRAGYHVRIFERAPQVQPLGGAVLLSLPVLSILRSYGLDISRLGAYAEVQFRNSKGKLRAALLFNKKAEERARLPGWQYGMLRSDAFEIMLGVIPGDVIWAGYNLLRFEESEDTIRLYFESGEAYEADLLVGANGIRSIVARQLWGDPNLFHCGIQVWLAWCRCDSVPRNVSYISHSSTIQASSFRCCTKVRKPSNGG
jgi:2-polyprenyl-6-methoxyphenol hydroxylase-like FAD-dependent oxidoreductase